jgi:hypothetical protein
VWGSVKHHGFLRDSMIVSDDAGQLARARHEDDVKIIAPPPKAPTCSQPAELSLAGGVGGMSNSRRRKFRWRSIHHVSIIIKRPPTTTRRPIIIIRPNITTHAASTTKPSITQLRLMSIASKLTNTPRLLTPNLTNSDACLGAYRALGTAQRSWAAKLARALHRNQLAGMFGDAGLPCNEPSQSGIRKGRKANEAASIGSLALTKCSFLVSAKR